jgi:hypothetical protein
MAEPVALGIKPPQGMSLGDMLNIARGAQEYQQAQQLNPLALQKAQAETEVATGTVKPRITQAEELARTARVNTNTAELENLLKHQQNSSRNLLKLLNQKEEVTPTQIKDHVVSTMVNAGAPTQAITQAVQNLPTSGTDKELRAFLAKHATNSLTAEAQLEKLFPSATLASTGKELKPITLGSPQLAENAPGTAAGPSTKLELSPEARKSVTQTDPVSGDTIVYDVDQNGQPTNVRFLKGQGKTSTSGSPDVAPNKSPFSQFGKPPPQENVPQSVPQGSTASTMQGQATDLMTTFMSSNKLLSDASLPGHIPTQEFVARKLLTFIKDPAVNTGPIADVLAGKTNQASLSAKEQEVVKLIQQRIQNLNPRTDADAESKKAAYGSFKLKKEALEDLVRDDLGSIANQKLLAQGIVKSGGDPNRPNLQGVNTFKNDFTKFSQNPILMRYIGIVGTKNTVDLDKSDEQALKKLYSTYKISKEGRNALEDAREELVKMSAGGR